MQTILHILFIGAVLIFMIITLPISILLYMFTGYNFIDEINQFALTFEKKHFDNGK